MVYISFFLLRDSENDLLNLETTLQQRLHKGQQEIVQNSSVGGDSVGSVNNKLFSGECWSWYEDPNLKAYKTFTQDPFNPIRFVED